MGNTKTPRDWILDMVSCIALCFMALSVFACVLCVGGSVKARGMRYGFDNKKYQLIKPLTTTSVLLAETDGDSLKSTSKMFIYSDKKYINLVNMNNEPVTYQTYTANIQRMKDVEKEKKDKDSFLNN